MIDEVDGRLEAWVATVLGETPVSFAAPRDAHPPVGISLYLLELGAAPPGRGDAQRMRELWLRYLVTAWADDPREAHRLLGTLVFAAMEDETLEVELAPLPAMAWAAFGAAPRPAFLLRAPLRRERPQPRAKTVRKPLQIELVATSPLRGVVLGPDDVPVAGARIDLPRHHLACYSGPDGRFRFPRVPSEPQAKDVRVSVKGRRLDLAAQQAAAGDVLVIRFDTSDSDASAPDPSGARPAHTDTSRP